MIKTKQKQGMIKKITEGGLFLALLINLNIFSNFYVTRLFPEGGAINISFIFIMVLVYRHGPWFGAFINLLGVTIVYAVLRGGVMFPPAAFHSWWQIMISILLDYIGSSFIVIVISYYVTKFMEKIINNRVVTGVLFIVLRCILGFTLSFLSGVLVWWHYAQFTPYGVYLYSFIFNITLSGGQCVVGILFFIPLFKIMPELFTKVAGTIQNTY